MQQLASLQLPAQAATKPIRTSLSLVNLPMSYRAGCVSDGKKLWVRVRTAFRGALVLE
ncbi:MAG: hypothetical protein RIR22_1359 [Planctomycetota bacterium]|jgi:hypothetical protein